MTYLVERLAELRRYLDHLHRLRPRVPGRDALERDLSLHNDVLNRRVEVVAMRAALAMSRRAATSGPRSAADRMRDLAAGVRR